MKTNIIKLFLLFIAILSALQVSAYDFMVDGLAYNFNSDGTSVTVTYSGSGLAIANIPASVAYNGKTYSVTTIGEEAFDNCTGLTSVTIPNSVTSIGAYAFYGCSGLTSVIIPNSVTSIDNGVFEDCSGLTSITIGNSVTSISDWAFADCSGLTSVTIGNSVTSFGYRAFNGCNGLTTLTWNAINCLSNGDITTENISNVSIGSEVKVLPVRFVAGSKITAIDIPNSVTTIGNSAFSGCSGLASVIIGNSVTSIGESAFADCSGLTSITIGNSVTSIGAAAFYGCSGLTTLTWNAINCPSNGAMPKSNLTSVIIGSNVQTLPQYFAQYSKITSITIPNSVTSIGNSAFADCSELASMFVESGNPNYDSRNNCNAIIVTASNALVIGCKNTIIPNSIIAIGDKAFNGCTGLTSVTIPQSVTMIIGSPFLGCSNLKTVNWNVKNFGEEGYYYYNFDSGPFRGATNSITTFNFGDNVELIPESLCRGMHGLTTISIPNSVTTIEEYAFENCDGLKSLTIGNSVKEIARGSFEECEELTSVTIPNSVTFIGKEAFYLCRNLTSVIIGNSVTYIGDGCFKSCHNLSDVICLLPKPITINASVFDGVQAHGYCDLHVPKGSKIRYEAMDVWKEFAIIVEDAEDFVSPSGDVNGDDKVNVSDVSALINMILGLETMNQEHADVNGDGRVNVSDVTALINIILGIE